MDLMEVLFLVILLKSIYLMVMLLRKVKVSILIRIFLIGQLVYAVMEAREMISRDNKYAEVILTPYGIKKFIYGQKIRT